MEKICICGHIIERHVWEEDYTGCYDCSCKEFDEKVAYEENPYDEVVRENTAGLE